MTKISANKHFIEVLRGGGTAFFLKVMAAGFNLSFNLYIARMLGADGTGLFFLGLTFAIVGSVICRMGFDYTIIRFVAKWADSGQLGKARLLYFKLLKRIGTVSILSTLLVIFLAPYLAESMGKLEFSEPLKWMAPIIFLQSMIIINASFFKGLKNILVALSVENTALPLLALIILLVLGDMSNITFVCAVYMLSMGAITIVSTLMVIKSLPTSSSNKQYFDEGHLLQSSKHLYLTALMQLCIKWFPLLVLGYWGTSEDVGCYGMAFRIAFLMTFILVAINAILMPKLSALFSVNDKFNIQILCYKTSRIAFAICLPILVFLTYFSDQLALFLGEGFVAVGDMLILFCVAQFVNVATGSVQSVLMMSGNEKIVRDVTTGIAFSSIILCLLFIEMFGAIGAVLSASLMIILNNLLLIYFAWKRLNLFTVPFILNYKKHLDILLIASKQ